MTPLRHIRAALNRLLLLVPLLLTVPAAAQDSDYALLTAAQLVEAMQLDRDTGKAAEGTQVTVDMELDEAGRIVASKIVEVVGAPDDSTRLAVQDALANALAHHQTTPFEGLRPEDRALWGRMRVTWAMGLHVGGYQP